MNVGGGAFDAPSENLTSMGKFSANSHAILTILAHRAPKSFRAVVGAGPYNLIDKRELAKPLQTARPEEDFFFGALSLPKGLLFVLVDFLEILVGIHLQLAAGSFVTGNDAVGMQL